MTTEELDTIERKATAFLARWGKSSRVGHEIRSELERSAQDIALVADVRTARAALAARDEDLRKLRWCVVANAGRLSLRGPAPRWSHVMSAAGLGSTSAKALCVATGFDPEEQVGSWPEPCETCAVEEEEDNE